MYISLERESSPVDWCEDNYTVSPYIAEFVNTISNILFLILPPVLMSLHKPYANKCGPGIHIVWVLLIVVGLSSAYFHATLSLLGQLLDEMAILWVVMAGFSLWYPRAALPGSWKTDPEGRRKFSVVCMLGATLATFLGFIQPVVNAFFLFTLSVPASVLLALQLKVESDARVVSLGKRSLLLWSLAIFCWVNDRMFCEFWSGIGFPYLHGFWHILIFLASYTAIVLFAYFEVKNHIPGESPILRYYPVDEWQFGIPYVILDQSKENGKHH
jgi:alkaline ceramidase